MDFKQLKNRIESHSEEYGDIYEQNNPDSILEIVNIQDEERTWHRLLEYLAVVNRQT